MFILAPPLVMAAAPQPQGAGMCTSGFGAGAQLGKLSLQRGG